MDHARVRAGALFVIALPPLTEDKPAHESPNPVELPRPMAPSTPPQLTTIEAVFDVWKDYARWSDDTAEVALWNAERKEFSDFYEVRRFEGVAYFRTIPRLTRRSLTHGRPLPPECPLRFTETEEQYREWLENGRVERPSARDLRPRASSTILPPLDGGGRQVVPPRVEAPKVELPPLAIEPPR